LKIASIPEFFVIIICLIQDFIPAGKLIEKNIVFDFFVKLHSLIGSGPTMYNKKKWSCMRYVLKCCNNFPIFSLKQNLAMS